MCTELCDDKAHFSVPRGAWREVGLDFLDALLAFRGLETRSLTVIVISTVGELEAPTSCCCERAFHRPAVWTLRRVGTACLPPAWGLHLLEVALVCALLLLGV